MGFGVPGFGFRDGDLRSILQQKPWPTSCIQDRSRLGCGSPEFGAPPQFRTPLTPESPEVPQKTQMCRKGCRLPDPTVPYNSLKSGEFSLLPHGGSVPSADGRRSRSVAGQPLQPAGALGWSLGAFGFGLDGGFRS